MSQPPYAESIGRVTRSRAQAQATYDKISNLYEWGHRKFPQLLDCRPIFVQQALEDSGFEIVDANLISLWGLSVEIVLAVV